MLSRDDPKCHSLDKNKQRDSQEFGNMRKNISYQVMLLLVSGGVSLCSLIHREYYLVPLAKSWDDAQVYCREKYFDLAVIGDHEDMKRLMNTAAANGVSGPVWIGLKKDGAAVWRWSVGDTQRSHGLVNEYTNWAGSPEASQHCGGMRHDGKWLSALCQSELPFVCQGYDRSSGMYVVLEQKTWRKAQDHCRLNNSDLANARTQTENQKLQSVIQENLPGQALAWIGLSRDEWRWSDQNESSFRNWFPSQPNQDGICVLQYKSGKWYDRGCSSTNYFFCYVGMSKFKRQIVKVEMKSDAFYNFNNFATREIILKQIQRKNGGVKLKWRIQPDGEVFHRKEKTKNISDVCEDKA